MKMSISDGVRMNYGLIMYICLLYILNFVIARNGICNDNLDSFLIKAPEDKGVLNRVEETNALSGIIEQQDERQLPTDHVSRRLQRAVSATDADPCSSKWNAVIDETTDKISDTSDFCKLLVYNDLYVDKTLLIPEVLNAFVTAPIVKRPSGWGKTVNMDMMKRFLELELDSDGFILPEDRRVNRKLFVGGKIELPDIGRKQLNALKVAQHEDIMQHQGQYPVLYVSFKDVIGETYQQIEDAMKKKFADLFRKYGFLISVIENEKEKDKFNWYCEEESDIKYLQNGLHFLSELLYKRFNKSVYVLIDDHDSPLNHLYFRLSSSSEYQRGSLQSSEEFRNLLNLFGGISTISLRRNQYLKQGLVTGCAMTNIFYYTTMDAKMSQFYGFSEEEVHELLTRVSFKVDTKGLKNWYYGYKFGYKFGDKELLYNPLSIMRCLSNGGKLDYYLFSNQNTTLIDNKKALGDWFQPIMQKIIAGNNMFASMANAETFDDIDSQDRVLNLLLFFGCLNQVAQEGKECELSACNEEMKYFLEAKFEEWLGSKLQIGADNELVNFLLNFRMEEFRNKLNRDMATYLSVTNTKGSEPERLYNVVLRSFLKSRDCKISHRQIGGLKKILIIEPANERYSNAAIIAIEASEYERDIRDKAMAGLKEINDMNYADMLRENRTIKKIIKMCATFKGVDTNIEYLIEEFDSL